MILEAAAMLAFMVSTVIAPAVVIDWFHRARKARVSNANGRKG